MCLAYAQIASSFHAGSSTGQARQEAAQRYGTPALQARYLAGSGGRDRQQELWQQRGAQVSGRAAPLQNIHDEPHEDATGPGAAGAAEASVTVQVTAQAAGGWTDQAPPYRLDCRLLPDPSPGWLVDDVAIEPLPSAPGRG